MHGLTVNGERLLQSAELLEHFRVMLGDCIHGAGEVGDIGNSKPRFCLLVNCQREDFPS